MSTLLRAKRLPRWLGWQSRLVTALARGGPARHRALAHYRAARLRRQFRHLQHRGRPVVALALVEHFGDIIAAEPLLRQARRLHPDALLVHVVHEKFSPLTAAHPCVDRQLAVKCLSEWYLASGRLGGVVEYDCHVPGRVCDTCQTVTRPTPPAGPISSEDYYDHGALLDIFARASGLDVTGIDRQPRLHLPPETRKEYESLALPGEYIVVHCRSNQAKRDWPAEQWNRLSGHLREAGKTIVEVGLRPVLAPRDWVIDLTGRLSLPGTCAVVAGARGFVGIDSGPAHVANAAGVPGVVLLARYGRFQKRMPFTGGYADGTVGTVVQYDGPIDQLPVDLAWNAIRQRF